MRDDYSFGLSGPCPYCRAGTHNGNMHDETCLRNLPDLQRKEVGKGPEPPYAKLLDAWLAGWEDKDHEGGSDAEVRAYFRGQQCRTNTIQRAA